MEKEKLNVTAQGELEKEEQMMTAQFVEAMEYILVQLAMGKDWYPNSLIYA